MLNSSKYRKDLLGITAVAVIFFCGFSHVWAEDQQSTNSVVTNATSEAVTNPPVLDAPASESKIPAVEPTSINSVATNSLAPSSSVAAEETVEEIEPVSIQGDQVEYSMKDNKVMASGNVVVKKQDSTLTCDKLEYYRETKIAVAEGNVVLTRNNQRMAGDKMQFNYETMKGEFEKVKVAATPMYGAGDKVEKIGDNHLRMYNGYMTTSDFDNPEFRLVSKTIDIYPGDKAVARNVKLKVGNFPLIYLPRYTQDLRSKEPAFLIIPGYKKDWGAFLMTQWRFFFNDGNKLVLHADLRARKGIAEGFDYTYKTKKYGEGLIRTYYMNERSTTAKFPFQTVPEKPVYKERFKGEWRHSWKIDEKTDAIWQYYKLSDAELVKDYFPREHEKDQNPPTYFLLTRGIGPGIMSFRVDQRVNRFVTAVDRLPELSYALSSQEIGKTQLYWKNTTTFSNLALRTPSPSGDIRKTMRLDTDNELSRPLKAGIFELTPFVGQRETYYSKTLDEDKYNSIRGIFRSGANVSTKFFKVYDVHTNKWGMDINRLRHVITPSAAYLYQHQPTVTPNQLDQFDAIDSLDRDHKITLSLENKLQTKRQNKNVDLARVIVESDFLLKEALGKGGFNNVKSKFELSPLNWLTFYADTEYDTIAEHLKSSNYDIYLKDPHKDKWYVSFGKRYNIDVDDQITTEVGYKINQKWSTKFYQRFALDTGTLKEQQYSIARDLHSWLLSMNFRSLRGEGDEIWLVMTLKAFPDMGFDFGTSFNKRKVGADTER